MFTESEVNDILRSKLAIEKAAKGKNIDKKKVVIPPYYPEYRKIVELANRLRPHYDMDVIPEKLLDAKAPNMDKSESDYAKNNYRPITTPFWGRAENSTKRIWSKDNFTINFKEDNTKFKRHPAKQYFEEEIPFHRNIIAYYASIITPWKLRDPNAVLAHKPATLPTKQDENGDLMVDQSKLIRPIPVVYMSHQLLSYEEEEHLLVELNEKSLVKVGSKQVLEGRVFEFYDDVQIYKIEQIGLKSAEKFKIEIFWTHDLKFLPVDKLRGQPEQKFGKLFFKSHFIPALPNLDDAVVNQSTLQLSIFRQAFPHKWEIADDCANADCHNGKVFDDKIGDGKWISCSDCGGSGQAASPTSVYKVTLPKRVEGEGMPPTPPFGFESPDIGVLDFLKKHVTDLIINAFRFLNIDVSNDNVKGSETALARQIDREEFFSFLTVFSIEAFELLDFSFKAIGKMRYGKEWESPDITKPINFSLRTFQELTKEISEAKTAGIPDVAIVALLDEYGKTRFNTNQSFSKILDVVLKIDSLILKTDSEIVTGISGGYITKVDAALHTDILQLIGAQLEKDSKFLEKDIKEIEEILRTEAKTNLPTPATPRDTSGILADVD